MKKSHFKFNKEERSGIFFLLLIIVLLQVVYFLIKTNVFTTTENNFHPNIDQQAQIEALKQQALKKDSIKQYPYNPNFITDYKGYTLGMSVLEIDKLHAFRKTDAYVNSAKEFQNVTGVSDSLLQKIEPYFKFPEWTKKSRQSSVGGYQKSKRASVGNRQNPTPLKGLVLADINTATAEDLKTVNGIGDKLSARIIKFRDALGGFMVEEQLYDVYGLEEEVVTRALKLFSVQQKPEITLININTASAYDLSKQTYINYTLAKNIVKYRQDKGAFASWGELKNIDGFPSEKINRIRLYLSLD